MANNMEQQDNLFYDEPTERMTENYHLEQYGGPFDYDAYNNQNSTMGYNQDFGPEYGDDDFFSSPHQNVFKPLKKQKSGKHRKKLYIRQNLIMIQQSNDLNRIESSVFGTNFANDNEQERISRISSALNAQKTARRYDSNRFGQNMATAFQIGTLILMVLACIL